VPESPLLRQLERKSGLIAFVGADFNVYIMDQAGENVVALTDDAAISNQGGPVKFYQLPTWAPDSQKLAFISISGRGQELDELLVYAAELDGSSLTEISRNEQELPYYLQWSPDGKRLTYLTQNTAGNSILKLVPADGGEVKIVDTGSAYYWDWSPDGRRLLVHDGGARGRLSFLTLDPFVIEEGLDLAPSFFHSPSWSPEGDRLLVAIEDDGGGRQLILADQEGNPIESLTTFEGTITFHWSPDGKKLAYIANVNPDPLQIGSLGPLTIVNLEKGKTEDRIIVEDELIHAFFWSPDSKFVAYFEPVRRASSADPEPAENQEVLQRLHVLEIETDESWEVTTFLPSDFFARNLLTFDQHHHSSTIWSPDGRSLVLAGVGTDGNAGIWVAPSSGGYSPRFLTEGVIAYWSWD
jgi:TolB protein